MDDTEGRWTACAEPREATYGGEPREAFVRASAAGFRSACGMWKNGESLTRGWRDPGKPSREAAEFRRRMEPG